MTHYGKKNKTLKDPSFLNSKKNIKKNEKTAFNAGQPIRLPMFYSYRLPRPITFYIDMANDIIAAFVVASSLNFLFE